VKELTHEQLYQPCRISQLNLTSTDELNSSNEILGQDRALQAIQFGVGMSHDGYNIFALGSPGLGKKTVISHILQNEKKSITHRTLSDWCYVHNFSAPSKPVKFSFPCGQAKLFKAAYDTVIKKIEDAIPELANNPDYATQLDSLFHALIKKHLHSSAITKYLHTVVQDISKNINHHQKNHDSSHAGYEYFAAKNTYRINVIIEHDEQPELPVIYEDHPTYHNLFGFVGQTSAMGTLSTDFTLIKPGALHRANGGYLIIDAEKLLQYPQTWDTLKQALRTKKIRMEPQDKAHNPSSNVWIDPEAIPLEIKIILMGERSVYYSLYDADSEMAELFKVIADYSETMEWTTENEKKYIHLIVKLIKDSKLLPFSIPAVGRIIEASARLADSNCKLSIHMGEVKDLLCEANYWARQKQNKIVHITDVIYALDQQIFRCSRAKLEYQDEVLRNDILIDVSGERVGTLNALTIMDMGNIEFGIPCRITGTTRLGEGDIVNIEREIDMSGAIHSKGISILSAFIGARFGQQQALHFFASLVFEQMYSEIEGDSASLAELCVLLSSLANHPLKQSIALTGSVNQHGDVQIIGGVNQKIEGFFDLCKEKGLTGEQGVIIPYANIANLMLHHNVVDAVKANQFHIYPVKHVDDALEILSDLTTGRLNEDNEYPSGSINCLINQRLKQYTEYRHHDATGRHHDTDDHSHRE